MADEQIPNWAIELIKQSTESNAKLTALTEWVERATTDSAITQRKFEERLRALEQFKWVLVGIALASSGLSAFLTKLIG